MPGIVHIFPHGGKDDFQVSLTLGTHSYACTYDTEQLADFLSRSASLDSDQVHNVLNQLHSQGSATVGDVSVAESEIAMMGMRELPTDA